MKDSEYKFVPLTQGKFAKVNSERYDDLMQWKWRYLNKGYAFRTVDDGSGKNVAILMHRYIKGLDENSELQVDHKNGDGLDNTDENLRVCTRNQNLANREKWGDQKYKGVYSYDETRWKTMITINGKSKYLGLCHTEEDGAARYNAIAKEAFGEFALLNEIPNRRDL